MKPHPKIRKTVKWGGLCCSFMLATLLALNSVVAAAWWPTSGPRTRLGEGAVGVGTLDPKGHFGGTRPIGMNWTYHLPQLQWWPDSIDKAPWREVRVPIWPLLALSIGCTVAAWVLDRRSRRGRCPKCNYDRTGLAAGTVCPECGKASDPQ